MLLKERKVHLLVIFFIVDEEYENGNVYDAELERYLCKSLSVTNLFDNPLDFWRNHQMKFPTLAEIDRQIFNIPAMSTFMERRSFSADRNIVTI